MHPPPTQPITNNMHTHSGKDSAIKALNKTSREALYEAMRREIAILKQFSQAKPAPNPNVLRLFQAFDESKKSLSFVA